jgi:proteic killer suppression protein
MIKSFGDNKTSRFFLGGRIKSMPPTISDRAFLKLGYINDASQINDLRSPPGNRLEKLSGNFDGFYSIRINDQWRIIFIWEAGHAHNVSIVDYHK